MVSRTAPPALAGRPVQPRAWTLARSGSSVRGGRLLATYSVEKLVNVQLLLQSQGEAGTEYAAA